MRRLLTPRRKYVMAGGASAIVFGFAVGTRFVRPRVDDEDSLCRPWTSSRFDFTELLLISKRAALFWNHRTQEQGDLERIREWHQRNGFLGGVVVRDSDGVPTFKDGSGYFLYYELHGSGNRTQHVFVRGTADRADALADIRASHGSLALRGADERERAMAVHLGFLETARALHDDLRPLLDERAQITLSGHSMGGAVATILALALKAEGFDVASLVTFGAPRLTDDAGGALAMDVLGRGASSTRLVRVANESDPFPSLPFWWWASPAGAAVACAITLAAQARAHFPGDAGPSAPRASVASTSSAGPFGGDDNLRGASSYSHFGPQLLFVAPERCDGAPRNSSPEVSTRFVFLDGETPTQKYGDGSGFLLGSFLRSLRATGDVPAHRMSTYQEEISRCLEPGAGREVRFSERHRGLSPGPQTQKEETAL